MENAVGHSSVSQLKTWGANVEFWVKWVRFFSAARVDDDKPLY
jgi:hypothetical protein